MTRCNYFPNGVNNSLFSVMWQREKEQRERKKIKDRNKGRREGKITKNEKEMGRKKKRKAGNFN